MIAVKIVRVITIAVNIDTSTPKSKVIANPFTNPVPNQIKINDVIIDEILLSRMLGQARRNPSSIPLRMLRPFLISSFVRSKIKIFASTAIPTERMNPAIPASVKVIDQGVTEESLKIATISEL